MSKPIDTAKVVAFAKSKIDMPYLHQGRTDAGYDCVGLLVAALIDQGAVENVTPEYGRLPEGESLIKAIDDSCMVDKFDPATEKMREGDILIFRINKDPQHVGLYIGNGRFLHACYAGRCIRQGRLGAFWLDRLTHIYRWKNING